jgi:hypothetical protein
LLWTAGVASPWLACARPATRARCQFGGSIHQLDHAIRLAFRERSEDKKMTEIRQGNVATIGERIVANEFEARGFRVSDLNKEGLAVNADLVAISSDRTFQIQVKGASNTGTKLWWVGYGHFTEKYMKGEQPLFNRSESFYKADLVVLVAVRSPREYKCVIMPVKIAEKAADLHRQSFRLAEYKQGKSHMSLDKPPHAKESEFIDEERKLLNLYLDDNGWKRLLKTK